MVNDGILKIGYRFPSSSILLRIKMSVGVVLYIRTVVVPDRRKHIYEYGYMNTSLLFIMTTSAP